MTAASRTAKVACVFLCLVAGGVNGAIYLADAVVNSTPEINRYYTITRYESGTKLTSVVFRGDYSDRQIAKGIRAATKQCEVKNVNSPNCLAALARKLIVALWRYLHHGLVPEGAMLKAH